MPSALFVALALAAQTPASPSPPQAAAPNPPPAPAAPVPAAEFEVKGFRSARFGMSRAEVAAAVQRDFGPEAELVETFNPIERTTTLTLRLQRLEPGPGPASIAYILGAVSRRLIHVNVVWALEGDPPPEQRALVAAAGAQLTRYFQSLPAPPRNAILASPEGPYALTLLAAIDRKGAGVEVAVAGVAYTIKDQPPPPPPTGPAVLRVSYVANAANPDIHQVEPGAF